MPSDAYMELADPAVWGETMDEQFGETGRNLGAFEISSFEFSATSTREDTQDAKKAPAAPGGTGAPVGGAASGAAAAVHSQTVVKRFTIKKAIDKASPDLFLACARAGLKDSQKIDWAIISVREMGEVKHQPYLILEFQGLWVDAFAWSLSPGAASDSAMGEETVTFSFETVLIKYARQQSSGSHTRVKIKGFNRVDPTKGVKELEKEALAEEAY